MKNYIHGGPARFACGGGGAEGAVPFQNNGVPALRSKVGCK